MKKKKVLKNETIYSYALECFTKLLLLLKNARAVSKHRFPALRELQPPRQIRRRHGPGHRVRRHRQQGGHRRPRAHAQRRRQLRAPGRAHRPQPRLRPAHRGHLPQGQNVPRHSHEDHHRQARRRDRQVWRHSWPGHFGRGRPQHVTLAAD